MEENFELTGEHEDKSEWKLALIDEEFPNPLEDGDGPDHWLEVELTVGSRWGDHYTFCFDGENEKFETDSARAIRDFSKFVDACIEMRDKMVDVMVKRAEAEN